ncbi:MAG: zinc metallopeptidase [Saprospiraceae bacterium]|nr:zinc metallopeptidase [Saprospiraceae bacterium]
MGLIVISIVFAGIGWLVSNKLKSKFATYSKMPLQTGLSGQEIASQMLAFYGIQDVKIMQGEGMLTDHYNPQTKIVNLSPEVYNGRSVASAAVAAHECGHAVQHAEAYAALKMRSALVPVVQISASMQRYLFMFGIIGIASFNSPIILMIAIAAFGVTTLFSLITLPVEFDASRRALAWLDSSNVTHGQEYTGAKDALTWAAMTYVAAALAALVQLLYLVMYFMGGRN